MSGTALDLKNRGNALFKSGRPTQAAELYAKAEALEPTDPVYPSNLSAAFYEAGNYAASIGAMLRSWKLITDDSNPLLAARLATRMCKALSYGLRDGSVKLDALNEHPEVITDIERVTVEKPEQNPKGVQMWKELRIMEAEMRAHPEEASESRGRLSHLPMFKSASSPTLDYHTIGQDQIMSLVDDWGPDHPYPLHLDEMPDEKLSMTSFLFGGVGDARHVYGTLIGLHRAMKALSEAKCEKFHVHVTMLDIHPGALARDLCILMLLHHLVESEGTDETVQLEIKATLFYTYVGVVMPQYCHERLQATIKDLLVRLSASPPRFPDWIHVDAKAAPELRESLDFWLLRAGTLSTASVLESHVPRFPSQVLEQLRDPSISSEYRARLQASIADKRQEAIDMIKQFKPASLRAMGLVDPGPNRTPQRKRMYDERYEEVVQSMLETIMDAAGSMSIEQVWYEHTKVFLPPSELWLRHPRFDVYRGIPTRAMKFDEEIMDTLNGHIRSTWKANPTLHDYQNPGRDPYVGLNPFQAPTFIEDFNIECKINNHSINDIGMDSPAFATVSDFFAAVVSALKTIKGKVLLELLCGELTQELSKMRFSGDDTRPAEFPRSFTRAYLSNVPDYTHGIINTIVYALPAVHCDEESAAAATSLLNTGIWRDNEEFCYTYTLLRSKDIPRYLGCRLISNDAINGMVIIRNTPLPRPMSELATRDELVTWLTRVLIYTIVPGSGGMSRFRARLPNNLVAFFALLVQLRTVGYPAHWLSEFLQCVLDNDLTTGIAPYMDVWPIPVSDIARRVPMRKVRLDPWRAELENILALSYRGLPFALSLPPDYATSHKAVGVFAVSVLSLSYLMDTLVSLAPHSDPGICLLFYNPAGGVSPEDMVSAIPSILEGRREPAQDEIYVLTAQEDVDLTRGRIRWIMSKERTRRMKAVGWVMVAYRTDTRKPVTSPVQASEWAEVA